MPVNGKNTGLQKLSGKDMNKKKRRFFFQVNIELSKSSYNLSKNLCNPTAAKAEQLDNWGKLLDLERLKNESDEDFRKRLSEKLPGKVM